ncbi:MAG: 2-dehydro-3-deoxyphosphogluconate aldolase [Oscillospiraceae bacterium]
MEQSEVKQKIEQGKVIVISRKIYGETLLGIARALYKGGVRMMEVTFDQADPECIKKTPDAIAMLRKELPDDMMCGAGTVLNEAQVTAAANAGALYMISPNVNERVIRFTKEKGLVSIPGAMTPSEILSAADYGADFIKIFPFSDLGMGYIKSIRGPINHLKLIATGGVTQDNFDEALSGGFTGAGVGGYLANRALAEQGKFDELTKRAEIFTQIASKH